MVKINIRLNINYSTEDIYSAVCECLPVSREEIRGVEIIRRSLNLSDKPRFFYDLTVALSFSEEREVGLLKMRKKVSGYTEPRLTLNKTHALLNPVVVGAGPAGLFAALTLAEAGASPILLERGLPVDERRASVFNFTDSRKLDTKSNIQYGEGGAGTFSDGKLKVGAMDKYKYKVLSEFVLAGADEDIMFSVGAHLGTDRLSSIVKIIREKIISLGGRVVFSARVDEITVKDGRVRGVGYSTPTGREYIETDNVIMATGHSARDSFELLLSLGIALEPRPFGIGVRLEHKREDINRLIYGENYPDTLGAASYHLVTHLAGGRSVYSFCMCPGGTVVAAASERGGIVTNGMSEYRRDGENSNAAILVSVTPDDFESDSPLAGLDLQRKIERQAFTAAGSDYSAPASTLGDFLEGREPKGFSSVKPTYPVGVVPVSLDRVLPEYICDALRAGTRDFDDWLSGYSMPEAVMTAPETRSTSPVRILRGDSLEALGIKGLYPAGEGAGYSGGIVSSARDGIMVAERLLLNNSTA